MSVRVNFYTFSKKANSTAQPTGTGAAYDCIFLDGADVLQPTIKLNVGMSASVTAYNYCYIQDFNRYYYVQRWFFDTGLWHAVLSVDPLASWKSAIGSYTGYVIRSSAASDGSIKDTFYPAKANPVHITKAISLNKVSLPWTENLSGGTYVVGVVSAPGSGVGSINYYAMTPTEFNNFLSAIYNNTNDWMSSINITDISTELLKTLFNPFEYIVSAMWFPMAVPTAGAASNIPLGWWSVPAAGAPLQCDLIPLESYPVTIDQHPQAATRGSYLNSGPYTNITVDFQPFGLFPLDASIVCGHSVTMNLFIDYITGTACLHVVVQGDNGTTSVIYSSAAMVGVPIQISGRQPSVGSMIAGAGAMFVDSIGATAGVLGDIASVSSTMFTEIARGGQQVANGASAILSAVSTGLKRMSSTGSNGSRAQLAVAEFYVTQDYLLLTDEDNAQFGRPLYQIAQVSNLAGYLKMGDSDISFPGLAEELNAVRSHLVNGFYYE